MIFYAILGAVGIFATGTLCIRIKNYFVERSRQADKKEDYLQHFVSQGLSKKIALDVYKYLGDWMNRSDFPVRPNDNLSKIYGIVDEDLDDLVIFAAESNNLALPNDTSYWKTPVETVDDVIRFVSTFKSVRSEACS